MGLQQAEAMSVVGPLDQFKRLDRKALFGEVGSCVEVEVAEIYTPTRFWLMHRSMENSQSLHLLMDRM